MSGQGPLVENARVIFCCFQLCCPCPAGGLGPNLLGAQRREGSSQLSRPGVWGFLKASSLPSAHWAAPEV